VQIFVAFNEMFSLKFKNVDPETPWFKKLHENAEHSFCEAVFPDKNQKMQNLITASPNVNHFLEDGGMLLIYLPKMPIVMQLFYCHL
jgi:hypothetical protein